MISVKPKGGTLPPPQELEAVVWREMHCFDYLPSGSGNVQTIGEIVRHGLRAIGKNGYVNVDIGFERQGTTRKPNRYDKVAIVVRQDSTRFGCELAFPAPAFEERKALFARAIEVARLPMVVAAGNDDLMQKRFSLEHTAGGEVWVGQSDEAPLGFECEMPGTSLDELLQRVDALLKEFASPKPFTLDWAISNYADSSTLAQCKEIYATATTFPSKKVWMMAKAQLGKIEAAEQLRILCGGSNRFSWQLCGFTLPSERAKSGQVEAKLWVVTNREGHRLSLEMKPVDPPLLPEIKKKLKAELRVLA